jgi:hypothetical protein
VDDLTIQRILRHGDVSITQGCYTKTLLEQSVAAMKCCKRQCALIVHRLGRHWRRGW